MSCIQNGRAYTLRNCQSGTVMDLSGGNNYSIIGFHNHGGTNQLWIFQRSGHGDQQGWHIKSAGSDKYLSIEGGVGDAGNGTKVVAVESESPFLWDVQDSDVKDAEGLRILVHGKKFSVDLSDKGNATDGTPVQLWARWQGRNQIWAPVEHHPSLIMSSIENGRAYTLRNCESGTVMDLSGGNNYSIIGFHNHGGTNQLWIFQRSGHGDQQGWHIKSAGSDKYLSIEGGVGDAGNGTKVVAVESDSPFLWDVQDSDVKDAEGLRILVHGKKFSVDLSDKGNATDGTPVQLWARWQGRNQIWAPVEHN